MTAFNPTEQQRGLRHASRDPAIALLLSNSDGSSGHLADRRIAGFSLRLGPIHPSAEIAPEALSGTAGGVVEVSVDDPSSIGRFQRLSATVDVPLIAAVYEAPLAFVRALIRAGAHDVLPLPIELTDLEATLAQLPHRDSRGETRTSVKRGRLVSVIKSGGGVGATALLGQLAIMYAQQDADQGRETCLIDLDLQFGDAAVQLGLRPSLSVTNLLEAGSRLDAALLQAATVSHASGLKVIGAPAEMMPLDSVSCDQLLDVAELSMGIFGTVFLDLPANWTDWSMSLVARSNLVLLVSELTVPALRQTRRQLDLLEKQDLGGLDLRIILNRHEDRLFKNIKRADASQALGRDIDYTISNDAPLVRAALDQGLPITEITRRSAVAKELKSIARDIASQVRQER